MHTSLFPRTAAFGLAALVTLGVMAGLSSLAGDEQAQMQRMAAQRAQQPLATAQAQDQAMAAQRAGVGMPVSVTIAPAAAVDCVSTGARI